MTLILTLITVCIIGVDAVRVPTTWKDYNPSTQRTPSIHSNYDRFNSWHNNPKRQNVFVPYFPATYGQESHRYREPSKIIKPQIPVPTRSVNKHRISKYKKLEPKNAASDFGNVPTKPIYRGEGLWAKPGLKHRPFIQPTTTHAPEIQEAVPEGYEIFKNGQNIFNKSSMKYNNLPNKINEEELRDEEEDEDDIAQNDFVPTRTYSQVRKYENEKHLPASVLEPRLKAIVTNSKIHTVYTEEGYEDGAYDHAGHEKEAEESEGFEEPETQSSEISTKIQIHPKKGETVRFAQLGEMKDQSQIDKETASSIRKDIERHFYSPRAKRSIDDEKYPYYKIANLPDDSSLRYALDLKSNPVKVEGKMSFYEHNNGVTCQEIQNKINPVPDKGQRSDLKLPRLPSLDAKIDCFKLKFFGEDPLDSPIFQEETVGELNPIFKEITNAEEDTVRISKNIENSMKSQRQPKVSDILFDTQNSTDYEYDYEEVEESTDANTGVPQAQALKLMRRRRRKRPQNYNYKYRNPPNRKLMKPKLNQSPVFSEVHYKNEIKPSEQLDVFADIINNIRNSTRDMSSSESLSSQRLGNLHSRSTTLRSVNIRRKAPMHRTNEDIYNQYMKNLKKQQKVDDSGIDSFYQPNRIMRRKNKKPFKESRPLQSIDTPVYYEEIVEPAVVESERKISGYTTIDIPLNKYLVPGMKPPLESEKPFIYSDYKLLQTNLVRRSGTLANHRSKRSPGRLTYSQIRRPQVLKDEKEAVEKEEEEDDYVPHRPTNFHYDPETDQIIYDKKKETTTEKVMEEYDEIEEITEKPKTTTTHRTVYHKDVLNKENGLTLADYLAQLKANPAYVYIPDPLPTEKTTMPSTSTLKPENTTPPEFFKFLQKLHNSEGYLKIEDEDEQKKKKSKTTTTEAPVEDDEEDEEEEEIQDGHVQNAPGGQFNSGGQLQIFDISEYLPNPKGYTPRTTIDYSKYKTIERPHSRHSLSSRYSEDEDELPLNKEEETTTTTTTTSTTTTTTSQAPITAKLRARKRPSRKPTTSASTTEAVTETNYTPATHKPASRVYPRRQRTKIRLRTTTPALDDEDASSEVHRTQRRLQDNARKIPPNHKTIYTPITSEENRISQNMTEMLKRPRLVTPDILNYNRTRLRTNKPGEINPRKLDVEIFKEYDTTKHHGGNYIRENGPTKINLLKESEEVTEKKVVDDNKDYQFDDEVKIYFKGKDGKMKTIIKDPSKRLYFYAPVKK